MANDILLAANAWSYTGNPSVVPRDHVRELVGDVDSQKKKVGDVQIELALATHKNVYFAAAAIARQIAMYFADRPVISSNGVSENWQAVYDNYMKMADRLEAIGQEQSFFASGAAAPQAISHSRSKLQAALEDQDRNWGPISAAGSMLAPEYDPET